MYADQQVTFEQGDSLDIELFGGEDTAKITWASFGILGVASLIISIWRDWKSSMAIKT